MAVDRKFINDIDLQGTYKAKNAVDPTGDQDYATKKYVDDNAGGGLPDPSGEPDGQWLRTASGTAVWVAATASDIPFVPAGTISATDVQAAIEEVASEAGGGVPTSRTLTAGAALTGGGDLSADRTFDVAVDGATIEVNADALRVKAEGIGATELASTAVTPTTYGDSSHVGQFTVDGDGRITAASSIAIPGVGSGGSVKLYDFTVGTAQASVDTNVDGTTVANFAGYDILEIWILGKTDQVLANSSFTMILNNDASSIYDLENVQGVGAAGSGNNLVAGANWPLGIHGNAGTTDYPGVTRITFPGYASTVFNKVGESTMAQNDATAGNNIVRAQALGYRSTAAITRIKIACTSTFKFVTGSRLLVFGR